jgi:hypothetical protein
MSNDIWAQVIAVVAGILITVAFRLVDKYLPDPEGKHPLPENTIKPGASGAPSLPSPAPSAAPAAPPTAVPVVEPMSENGASDGRSTGSGATA